MAKLEPGQRAYETLSERRGGDMRYGRWESMDADAKADWAAVEQACAVPAVAERGGEAVEAWKLANGYDDLLKAYSEAVSASARRRELLSRVYMWRGSGLPSGLWRDLETELNGPKAEAGKAQAEGLSLAVLQEFVAFLDREHAKSAASPTQSGTSIGYQNGLYVASLNLKALLPPPPASQLPAGETER
jgi:hypothetical protein